MARVAYSASKKQFVQDWQNNDFMAKMEAGAYANRIGGSPSEKKSWESNAAKIVNLLELASVPDDVYVAFEYKSPLAGRVDCMLFALGKDGRKQNIENYIDVLNTEFEVIEIDGNDENEFQVIGELIKVLPDD